MRYLTLNKLSLLLLLLLPNLTSAFSWQDLWLRPDQQGAQALQQQHAKEASEHFSDPEWRAVAAYKAGDYQQAAATLQDQPGARAHYNRGNALAQLKQYETAIQAYDKALASTPNDKDLQHNKALVQKLLKKQRRKQRQKQQQQKKQQRQEQRQQKKQQRQEKRQQKKQRRQEQRQQKKQRRQEQQQQKKQQRQEQQQQKKQQRRERRQQEQQQAMKKSLEQIPDDPGGLLKQKFLRDYQRRQQAKEA